jgi:4,5-dihydroxyphthalate decarboxylase
MTTSLAGAALASRPALGQVNAEVEEKTVAASGKLRIKVAGYQYDRVAGLADGRVQIEGCETHFEEAKIGDMNTHVFSGPGTREVTEIGLHPFMLAYANDGFRDYTLIPVFPLRLFRHKSIFIRTDRGIEKAEDLRGKKVATAGYSSTSLTWIRGIMQHEYGVKPTEIEWTVSAQDSSAAESGGPSKQENVVPEGISMKFGPEGKDESEMLADGDVDALFHAAEPAAYVNGHPKVARLFPDYRMAERVYFSKTGIFPIMHAVAMRKDVVEENPWLPEAVFKAYSGAKARAYEHLRNSAWAYDMLPWIGQEFEETREAMGDNYWSYGIEDNRTALEALFRYSHEQGLASRELTIEELFHPSTLELREAGA